MMLNGQSTDMAPYVIHDFHGVMQQLHVHSATHCSIFPSRGKIIISDDIIIMIVHNTSVRI